MTIQDKYSQIEKIKTQEEADAFFLNCVMQTMKVKPELSVDEAVDIEKENIGYFSGYLGQEHQQRIEILFRCVHPIFGPYEESKNITPDQAFKLGQELVQKGNMRRFQQPKEEGFAEKLEVALELERNFENRIEDIREKTRIALEKERKLYETKNA